MTVLQDLIKLINDGKLHSMLDVMAECHILLGKEKQQIIKAYCDAEDKWEFFEYERRYNREHLTAEDYYNSL